MGTREMRRVHEEGGSDFNIHLVDVYNAWQAFPSLLPSHFSCTKTHFPFSMKCLPHRLSDVIQSVYLFTLFNICDPPQEFDAKGESTLTTRLHDTLSVP